MVKFAFLINVPGQSPDTYCTTYENSESYNIVVGTADMDMAARYVEKLVSDGYTIINLCGDFDDEVTSAMQQKAGDDIKIRNAHYFPEELLRVEALEEFSRYGIIVVMNGVEEPAEVEINGEGLYTKAIFVKDQQQANEAAKKLADEGVHDIELCSWFDKARTEKIIETIDARVPVGSCGSL